MATDRHVWLRRMKIANFRGYGGQFDIAFPTRGSVVLLSGANGLGKTSFFEAIEWGLTGGIARLERLSAPDKLELIRKHSGVNECAVKLHFSQASGDQCEERIVHRTCTNSSSRPVVSGSTSDSVVDLLRNADDKWAVSGGNLVRYLYLTHFHPQSAPLRLIARSADDRWSWVSQLAGTERLELVRQRVRASKNSLTKIVNQRESAVEVARSSRKEWANWVAQYERLRNQVTALVGALTPDDVVARLARVVQQLSLPPANLAIPAGGDENAIQEALAATAAVIEQRHASAQQQLARLQPLRDAARRWIAAKAEALASDSLAVAAREQIGALQPTLDRLEADLSSRRELLAEMEAAALRTSRALAIVSEVLEARRERVLATESLAQLQPQIAEHHARMIDLQRAAASAESDMASMRSLEARQREVEREQRALAQAAIEYGTLAALRGELTVCAARRAELTVEGAAIQSQEREAVGALDAASVRLRAAKKNLEGIAEAADAVTRSLAVIVAHIHEDDTVCPVCTSEFPAGVLKTLADSSSSLLKPALSAAQSESTRAELSVRALEDQVERLRGAQRSNAAELASATELHLDLSRRIDTVLSLPAIAGGVEAAIPQMLERRTGAFAEEAAALKSQLGAYPLDEELAARIAKLKLELSSALRIWETARAEELASRRRIAELVATEDLLAEQNLDRGVTDAELGALKDSYETELREANGSVLRERDLVSDALRRANDVRERRNALAVQEGRARTEESERQDRASQIASTWPALLGPEPSEAAVDKGEAALARDVETLATVASDLRSMTSGFHAWVHAGELRDLERRLWEKSSNREWNEYTATLESAILTAAAAFDSAKKVRLAADTLGETLRERTSEFNELVLEPIQGLFGRYLRALIHDDRFHDVGFEPHTGSSSGSLHFQLRVPDWDMRPAEAEMILSEGQLAELSLAALFATSSAYRWSDWRALLLDDPTQYNDLVHSTSLLEVVRNLACFQGYQIFLSTHDLQQAAFFRRKLEGMNVPWTECRFTGQGDGGIEYVVTSAKNE